LHEFWWQTQFHSLFPKRLQYCSYSSTALTCTTTIIRLKPCALNAEFQHFMLRFNKIGFIHIFEKVGTGTRDSLEKLDTEPEVLLKTYNRTTRSFERSK
jgi:hypothetical protein